MNIKVVIVWIIAIIACTAIGVFGYLNQNLLIDPSDYEYEPPLSNAENTRVCNKSVLNGESIYEFTINENTNTITSVLIIYRAFSLDFDSYSAATNIANANIPGVEANLSGGSANFVLEVRIDINSFDKEMTDSMLNDFMALSMVVEKITNYAEYQRNIDSISSYVYNCN